MNQSTTNVALLKNDLLDLRYEMHLFQLLLKGITVYIRDSSIQWGLYKDKKKVCVGGNNPSQRVNKYGWMFKELTEKVGKEKYENLVHNEKQAQCIESGQLLNLYGHCYFSCQKWNINLNIFSQRPTKTNTSSHWMKMINDIHIIYFMLWALL